MKRGTSSVLASACSGLARWGRKAAAVSVGLTLAFGALPATAAHAKPHWVTWKNFADLYGKRYLEVLHSSKKKGAAVGAYKWNGSMTQWWWDQKLSDGYYVEFNGNSNLLLTAYNSCGSGVTQWPTDKGHHAFITQEWKQKHLKTYPGWVLINKGGCDGDSSHDVLSLSVEHFNWYNVFLYPESFGACNIHMYPSMGPQTECVWQ
jgi:hypothetical protein